MVGVPEAKDKFRELVAISRLDRMKEKAGMKTLPYDLHLVMEGSPGTGKSTFAANLAKAYYGAGIVKSPEVVSVSGRDFVSGIQGQTAGKVDEIFDRAKGKVLVVDEAYGMVNSPSDEYGIEALNQFVKLSEERRHETVIILAGYGNTVGYLNQYNPGLETRFPEIGRIPFEDYTGKDLTKVALSMAEESDLEFETKASPNGGPPANNALREFMELAQDVEGNARGARNFVNAVRVESALRITEEAQVSGKTPDARAMSTVTESDVISAAERLGIIGGFTTLVPSKVGSKDAEEMVG